MGELNCTDACKIMYKTKPEQEDCLAICCNACKTEAELVWPNDMEKQSEYEMICKNLRGCNKKEEKNGIQN